MLATASADVATPQLSHRNLDRPGLIWLICRHAADVLSDDGDSYGHFDSDQYATLLDKRGYLPW